LARDAARAQAERAEAELQRALAGPAPSRLVLRPGSRLPSTPPSPPPRRREPSSSRSPSLRPLASPPALRGSVAKNARWPPQPPAPWLVTAAPAIMALPAKPRPVLPPTPLQRPPAKASLATTAKAATEVAAPMVPRQPKWPPLRRPPTPPPPPPRAEPAAAAAPPEVAPTPRVAAPKGRAGQELRRGGWLNRCNRLCDELLDGTVEEAVELAREFDALIATQREDLQGGRWKAKTKILIGFALEGNWDSAWEMARTCRFARDHPGA